MAFVAAGNDIALARNQSNGKWDIDWETNVHTGNKGNPRYDSTRRHSIMVTLVSKRRGKRPGSQVEEGGYYWDTSGVYGTLLWTVIWDRMATESQLTSYAQDAGQQLSDFKLISTFAARARRLGPGKWTLTATWTVPGNSAEENVALTL